MSRIKDLRAEALAFHKDHGGKIELGLKCPARDLDDLTLAYSPGVAEPCKEIERRPDLVNVYTNRANCVCVVSDGTAVLGLGDIGPAAALPVMEGKALLFKRFADVDAFPLCVNTREPDKIVELIELMTPSFGGVNLEDIKAPQCFDIERKLKSNGRFRGPVFHDDQHGTAVVTLAGLVNALKVVGKSMKGIKAVINGAGAAGMAIVKLLMACGLENVIMCDSQGTLWGGRCGGMNRYKEEIAEMTNPERVRGSLDDALRGADVFIGVSAAGVLCEDMIRSMGRHPVVFAQANPVPEIWPIQRALAAGAAVVATGRSDVPNQINNVLAFPGIFRGALDVGASDINDSMKIAAAYAIAAQAEEGTLCAEAVVPSVFNPDVAPAVAAATAEAAVKSGVARNPVDPQRVADNLRRRLNRLRDGRGQSLTAADV